MSILIDKETRVIVQGITGKAGAFHAQQCIDYGTKIVAGVTPGKGGQVFHDCIPIVDSVEEAVNKYDANASLLFVPAAFAKDAILEAIDASMDLIVCITEGIPIHDMMYIKDRLKTTKTRLIGPNCPGLITPEECKIGIMPGYIHKKGPIGVMSRSGTLTYEAVWQLSNLGHGQSTCIGIGGDPIVGTSFVEVLELFNKDPQTQAIVMIGEVGGQMEEEAALFYKNNNKKPILSFIAGQTAPPHKRMGHAGAIASGATSAKSKIAFLEECGIPVALNPSEIGVKLKEILCN